MNTKNIVIVSVVFALVFLGGSYLSKPVINITDNGPIGASSGTTHTERETFNAGLSSGGYAATTSAVATYTTVAKDFNGTPSVISWLPNLNTTISLSSTSTHAYVPKIGDTATIYLRNASTTAAASITFAAADANMDLQMAEATGGDLVLVGLDWEKITLVRTGTYLVTAILDEMTEAD